MEFGFKLILVSQRLQCNGTPALQRTSCSRHSIHWCSALEVNCLAVNVLNLITVIMAALWNRAGHYIFALLFLLSSSSVFFFPRLISAVAGLKHAARCSLKIQDA